MLRLDRQDGGGRAGDDPVDDAEGLQVGGRRALLDAVEHFEDGVLVGGVVELGDDGIHHGLVRGEAPQLLRDEPAERLGVLCVVAAEGPCGLGGAGVEHAVVDGHLIGGGRGQFECLGEGDEGEVVGGELWRCGVGSLRRDGLGQGHAAHGDSAEGDRADTEVAYEAAPGVDQGLIGLLEVQRRQVLLDGAHAFTVLLVNLVHHPADPHRHGASSSVRVVQRFVRYGSGAVRLEPPPLLTVGVSITSGRDGSTRPGPYPTRCREPCPAPRARRTGSTRCTDGSGRSEVESRQLGEPGRRTLDGALPALPVERRARVDDGAAGARWRRCRPNRAQVPSGQPGQEGGAERGGLEHGRHLDRAPGGVGQGLHERGVVAHAAVDAQRVDGAPPLSVSAASTRSAPRWATPSSTARTTWARPLPRVMPEQRAPGAVVPVGRAEPEQGGDVHDAVGVGRSRCATSWDSARGRR